MFVVGTLQATAGLHGTYAGDLAAANSEDKVTVKCIIHFMADVMLGVPVA